MPFKIDTTVHGLRPLRRAVLALGSNLGDRLGLLQQGVTAIGALPDLMSVAVSPVYESVAWGMAQQPDFLNLVLLAETTLKPNELLKATQAIEDGLGRVRSQPWGPRTLDIDVIALGRLVRTTPELTLPHPHAHERAFVVLPWLDVEPDAKLPGLGPVAGLVAGLDNTAGRRDDLEVRL